MRSPRAYALKFTVLMVALAGPVLIATAPVLAADGPFAAIAYSPSTGKHGWARSSTRSEAERAAIAKCDATDARVVTWAHGGFYCALAVDPDNPAVFGRDYGSSANRARAGALKECGKTSRNPDRCRIAICVYSGSAPAKRTANQCIRCGRTVLPFSSYCRSCDVRR